ncbi:MAG: hypothetical protein GX483_02805 [Actinomycetaceae bacterium]|nr:hypothetical protein [Actinomycetaceae bacterium]
MADARVSQLLERFGIDHIGDNEITRASGGQLQRAAICRAIVMVTHDPPVTARADRIIY